MRTKNGEYYAEYSFCNDAFSIPSSPIDMFDLLNGNETQAKRSMALAGDEVKNAFRDVLEAQKQLPFASEKYLISSKMSDYVVIPTSIMTTEIPNRNRVGFPFSELSAFNPEHGKIAYKTWQNKPNFLEHDNLNIEKAKGMIFDSAMRKLHRFEGDLWQVVLLNAFDRSKDAELANKILKKEAIGYSMGAWVRDYQCSVCSASLKETRGKGCKHIKGKSDVAYSIYNGKLAYWRAIEPIGFECSSVAVPAYIQAVNPDYI